MKNALLSWHLEKGIRKHLKVTNEVQFYERKWSLREIEFPEILNRSLGLWNRDEIDLLST